MIPRLFIEDPLSGGLRVTLDHDRTHYLKNVMRRAPGDSVGLFNGRDGEWMGAVESYARNATVVAIGDQRRPQSGCPDLWLAFAPVKRARIDLIAEKATELGASVLWPVKTRRSDPVRVNLERLRAIAIEAAEQTERLDIPEIREPAAVAELFSAWPPDRTLFVCAEAGEAAPIADAIAGRGPGPAGFLVGPEGGFEPAELDGLRNLPFAVPVGLGPRLLRAETAAIAALACWQALAGDGRAAASRPPFRQEFANSQG